jgi:hypothetical protein
VLFDAVPVDKTVVITRVSCRAEMSFSSGSTISLKEVVLQVLRPDGTDLFRNHFLTPVLIGSENQVRYYQINNDALHLYNARRVPRIVFRLGQNPAFGIVISCQLGGTIQ